jgi:hypothetical protein
MFFIPRGEVSPSQPLYLFFSIYFFVLLSAFSTHTQHLQVSYLQVAMLSLKLQFDIAILC